MKIDVLIMGSSRLEHHTYFFYNNIVQIMNV